MAIDLANEHLLTARAISNIVDGHHLKHLGLFDIPSLEAAHFSVSASSTNQLVSLYLVGDTIDDVVLHQLATGGKLRVLFVDNTDISDGAVADALRSNPELAELVISNCPVSVDTLVKVKKLNALRLLNVSHISADSVQIKGLRSDLLLHFPEAQITLSSAMDQNE